MSAYDDRHVVDAIQYRVPLRRALVQLAAIQARLEEDSVSTHQFRAWFVEHDRLVLPRVVRGQVRLLNALAIDDAGVLGLEQITGEPRFSEP